jgi:DNA polymerase/3'-5' exonuclease PolX
MQERTASEVTDFLEEIGRRAALEGANSYRAKAYLRAAASLRRLPRPLDDIIHEGKLQSIAGVGAAIARRIEMSIVARITTDVGVVSPRRDQARTDPANFGKCLSGASIRQRSGSS